MKGVNGPTEAAGAASPEEAATVKVASPPLCASFSSFISQVQNVTDNDAAPAREDEPGSLRVNDATITKTVTVLS